MLLLVGSNRGHDRSEPVIQAVARSGGCKRYARRRKVNVTQVRALFGVMQDENVTKALLATTSGFTKKAREFAERNVWKLDLVDYDQLLRLIRKYAVKHA